MIATMTSDPTAITALSVLAHLAALAALLVALPAARCAALGLLRSVWRGQVTSGHADSGWSAWDCMGKREEVRRCTRCHRTEFDQTEDPE